MPKFKVGDYISPIEAPAWVYIIKEITALNYRVYILIYPDKDKLSYEDDGLITLSQTGVDNVCEISKLYKKYLHLQGLYDQNKH